jgi:hypothetical protein
MVMIKSITTASKPHLTILNAFFKESTSIQTIRYDYPSPAPLQIGSHGAVLPNNEKNARTTKPIMINTFISTKHTVKTDSNEKATAALTAFAFFSMYTGKSIFISHTEKMISAITTCTASKMLLIKKDMSANIIEKLYGK